MTLSQFLKMLVALSKIRRFHYGLTFYIDYDARLIPRRCLRLPILYRSSGKLTETPNRPLDTIEAVYFYLVGRNAIKAGSCSHPLAAADRLRLPRDMAEKIIKAANQTENYSVKLRRQLEEACGLTKTDKAKVLITYFGSASTAKAYTAKSLRNEEKQNVGILPGENETECNSGRGNRILRARVRAIKVVKTGAVVRFIVNKSKRRKVRSRHKC